MYIIIKFPFGIFGLKDLQKYHQYLVDEKSKKEVEAWLLECSCISEFDLKLRSISDQAVIHN